MLKTSQKIQKIIRQTKKELQNTQFQTIKKFREKINQPNFWQNPKKAKQISQKLNALEENLAFWKKIQQEARELLVLMQEKPDQDLICEINHEVSILIKKIKKKNQEKKFQGRYDQNNAIVSIYAGAGGTDAMSWAEMLLAMYLKFCEKKNWQTKILHQSAGEIAGIKNAVMLVKNSFAYGILKSEKGVHRLVRLSPFDADHARHTSFAKVEILPQIPDEEVNLKETDLEISTFRSSAPGGQHVNKTDSAVRIKHKPTNLVVECQSERSQHQNKMQALKVLKARLWEKATAEKESARLKEKGAHVPAEWGQQIRSYVLHPYKQIKDHRTGQVIRNVEEVLKGKLEPFLE